MWKPNTHVFAANKALVDALPDGMVTIPPYGEIAVNANVLRALRNYPTAYRAGVVGPDVFPDIWVGQSLVHVDREQDVTRWVSDDWLAQLFREAWSLPNGDERDRALAFTYGFLTHASGDMFAHTYVNCLVATAMAGHGTGRTGIRSRRTSFWRASSVYIRLPRISRSMCGHASYRRRSSRAPSYAITASSPGPTRRGWTSTTGWGLRSGVPPTR